MGRTLSKIYIIYIFKFILICVYTYVRALLRAEFIYIRRCTVCNFTSFHKKGEMSDSISALKRLSSHHAIHLF